MPTRLRKDVQNLALEQNPSSTSKKEKKSSIIDLRGKCESRQQKNSSEICALFWLTTLFRDHHLPFQFLSGSGHIHTWYKPLLKKNEFIYFNWRLITLQYFSGFCQTLTWISHGCTWCFTLKQHISIQLATLHMAAGYCIEQHKSSLSCIPGTAASS